MSLATLRIDNKWSVKYDPDKNDSPFEWLRYGVPTALSIDNVHLALFYELLAVTRPAVLEWDEGYDHTVSDHYCHAKTPFGRYDIHDMSSNWHEDRFIVHFSGDRCGHASSLDLAKEIALTNYRLRLSEVKCET